MTSPIRLVRRDGTIAAARALLMLIAFAGCARASVKQGWIAK